MSTGNQIDENSLESRATGGLAEYGRPWKLFTLFLGIALLVLGSVYYAAPHWDVPISLIMATLAYLAPHGVFESS